jgi:hypothetical protein
MTVQLRRLDEMPLLGLRDALARCEEHTSVAEGLGGTASEHAELARLIRAEIRRRETSLRMANDETVERSDGFEAMGVR